MSNGGGYGSLAQLGNQSIGQSIGYGISAQLASNDWDRYKNSLTRGFQYKMTGLRAAGLNPIMAVQGGLGIGMPQLPSSKPSSAGGPGGNPHLERMQARLLDAQSAKAVMEARLTSANLSRATGEAAFYQTPEGRDVIRKKAYNEALPNTWPGAAIKGGSMMWNQLKDWWSPPATNAKEAQKPTIGPKPSPHRR